MIQKNKSDKKTDTNAEESYLNESLRGIQLDTCLQPADIGQEVLDCYFDEEFDVAPAEGNNPIRVLKEEGIESKTFPCHYPSGKNTLTDQRDIKLSASRYFNLRLLSVENRFARDTSYIFFCQYLSELEKVMSNVQISLRKDFSKTGTGKTVTSDMICRGEGLKQLFKSDEDKYITCSIPSPDEDPELHKIAVQQHSKHHSKSCKKKGTNCRFNFPRPHSVHSFISRPVTEKDLTESDIKISKDKLETVWHGLPRQPIDETKNAFGDYLLDFLRDAKCCMLNGRAKNKDNLMYLQGRSVVD
ncbi:unnamed protein product [Mytilus edulis]|uniref:Uncharacterized protein n=1 Tax=Mytilus edulis TaxID=6550 RepID=A0A8S3PVG1_MYTED|nr:unnamed protein product [Mytilus edulis]